MKVGPYIGLYSEIITSYERNPGKSLPVRCHFQFKVALLDRVTQTVQTRLRSDLDYNTTIGSIRGYLMPSTQHTQVCVFIKITVQNWFTGVMSNPLVSGFRYTTA